jgi:quinol monooxygenase YgiN
MLIVFAYEVEPAERRRFARVYGRDGEWAAFFRADAGYLGTELHRAEEDPSRYLVIDHWASPAAYAAFLERNRDEYDRRSRATGALYRRETFVGRFLPEAPAPGLTLELLPGGYAACRLDPAAPAPSWARGGELCVVTRTAHELSIVCPEEVAPEGSPPSAGGGACGWPARWTSA